MPPSDAHPYCFNCRLVSVSQKAQICKLVFYQRCYHPNRQQLLRELLVPGKGGAIAVCTLSFRCAHTLGHVILLPTCVLCFGNGNYVLCANLPAFLRCHAGRSLRVCWSLPDIQVLLALVVLLLLMPRLLPQSFRSYPAQLLPTTGLYCLGNLPRLPVKRLMLLRCRHAAHGAAEQSMLRAR